MSVLLAVGTALLVLGVLAAAFSLMSSRQAGRGLAGLSEEDLSAEVVSIASTHGDNCPWPTAAHPLLALPGITSGGDAGTQDAEGSAE